MKRNTNSKIQKSISILCVIILVTAIVPSVLSVSIDKYKKTDNKTTEDNSIKLVNKTNGSYTYTIDTTKESKTQTNTEIEKETEKTEKKPFFRSNSIRNIVSFLSSDKNFNFYTNYDGIINNEELSLFLEKKIDINDDGYNDIGARYLLFPSFDFDSFSLSLNTRLVIRKLRDFPSKNACFKAYLEFYFPGALVNNLSGDRVRIGYESDIDESVPEKCSVTYKLIPNLLSKNKRVGHNVEINPKKMPDDSNLTMIYSYTDYDNENLVSNTEYRVEYSPAAKSELSISGIRKLGESSLSIEKTSGANSDINIYLSHYANDTYTYLYCLDAPNKVDFSIKHGKDGYVEYNTYGNPVGEIGLCDDLENPENFIYAKDFPSKFRFDWNRHLFSSGIYNISAYSEGSGIKLGGHLVGKKGIADFIIDSNNTLDCSINLDLKDGLFRIDRTGSDLFIDLSIVGGNGSYFNFSMNYKRSVSSPFEFYFDGILSGNKSEVKLAGKDLEITDLDINVHLNTSSIKGDGALKIKRLVKEKQGYINTSLSIEKTPTSIEARYKLEITNGWNATDVMVKFGGLSKSYPYLNNTGHRIYWINFSFNGSIDYKFAPDLSWGYINIFGGMNFFIDRYIEEYGEIGGVTGAICMKTVDSGLNFSWETIRGNLVWNINGGGLVSLEDFHLWFGEIVDVSIPSFKGSILLTDANVDSGILELNLDGEGSVFEVMDFSFASSSLFPDSKIDLNVSMENTSFGGYIDAYVILNWSNKTMSNFYVDVGLGLMLSIDNFVINFNSENASFNLVSDNFGVSGKLSIVFDSLNPNDLSVEGPLGIVMTDANVDLHIADLNFGGIDLDDITLVAESVGTCFISLEEVTVNISNSLNGAYLGGGESIRANISLGINTTDGDLFLHHLEIGDISDIVNAVFKTSFPTIRFIIENLTFKNGFSLVTFPVLLLNFPGNPIFPAGLGIEFDNYFSSSKSDEHTLTCDYIQLMLPDLTIKALSSQYDIPFSLEEYEDSYPVVFVENISLFEGKFGIYLELWYDFRLKVSSASALDNLDIRLGFLDVAYATLSLEEDFEYFFLDFNNQLNPENLTYILIDTHNSTIPFDVEIKVLKEFINFMGDVLANMSESETVINIPKANSDIILKFDSVKFKADAFYIYNYNEIGTNPMNVTIDGYLYLEDGSIWLFADNKWEQIAGGNISILVEPGHAKLHIDEQLSIPEYTALIPETNTQIYLSGSFEADDFIIEFFWNKENGSLVIEGLADCYVRMDDFHIKLINIDNQFKYIDCSIKSMVIDFDLDGEFYFITNGEQQQSWLDLTATINEFSITDFNLTVLLPGDGGYHYQDVILQGKFDLTSAADGRVQTDFNNTLLIDLYSGSITMSNFSLSYSSGFMTEGENSINLQNNFLKIEGDQLKIVGSGEVKIIGDEKLLHLSIEELRLKNCDIEVSREFVGQVVGFLSMELSGNLNLGAAADISYYEKDFPDDPDRSKEYQIRVVVAFYLQLSSFEIRFFDIIKQVPVIEWRGGTVLLEGYGAFIQDSRTTYLDANLNRIVLDDNNINIPDVAGFPEGDHTHFRLNFDIDLSASLHVTLFMGAYESLLIEFSGTLTISDLHLEITQYDHMTETGHLAVECNYITLTGMGSFSSMKIYGWNQNTGAGDWFTFIRLELGLTYILVNELKITSHDFSYGGFTVSGEISADVNAGFYIGYEKSFAPAPDEDSLPGYKETLKIAGLLRGGSISVTNIDIEGPDFEASAENINIYGYGYFYAKLIDGTFIDRSLQELKIGTSKEDQVHPLTIGFELGEISINANSGSGLILDDLNIDVDGSITLYVVLGCNPDNPSPSIIDNAHVDASLSVGGYIGLNYFRLTDNNDQSIVVEDVSITGSGSLSLNAENQYPAGSPSCNIDVGADLTLVIGYISLKSFLTISDFYLEADCHLYIKPIFGDTIDTLDGITLTVSGYIDFSAGVIDIFGITFLGMSIGSLIPNFIFEGSISLTVLWDDLDGFTGRDFDLSVTGEEGSYFELPDFEERFGRMSLGAFIFEEDTTISLSIEYQDIFSPNGYVKVDGHTSDGEVSCVSLSFDFLDDLTIDFGNLLFFSSGDFSFNLAKNPTFGNAEFTFTSNYEVSPDMDTIEISTSSKTLLVFDIVDITVPYLSVNWNIDGDWDGSINIDTDGQPITVSSLVFFDLVRFRGSSFTANDFQVFWNWDFTDGVLWPVFINGSISITGGSGPDLHVDDQDWKPIPMSMGIDPSVPVACFTYSPTNPTINNPVTFDSSCSSDDGTIKKIRYDFEGDGEWDIGIPPNHWIPFNTDVSFTYFTPGEYTPTIQVRDNELKVSEKYSQHIVVIDHSPDSPIACFNASNYAPDPNEIVNFNAECSIDQNEDGEILSYSWEFGDGSTGNGVTISHSYENIGLYSVNLTIKDNDNKVDTLSKTINVVDPTVKYPPVASFTWFPDYIFEGETVYFDGSDSYDPDGGLISPGDFDWDFGDGNSDWGKTPSHFFSQEGTYQVKLTCTDDEGQTDSVTHEIEVHHQDPANNCPETYLYAQENDGVWHNIGGTTCNGEEYFDGATTNLYNFDPYRPVGVQGSDTKDTDGYIRQYKWDIDGINDDNNHMWILNQDESIPDTSALFGNIHWNVAGVYSVKLSVIDNENCITSATIYMNIEGSTDPEPPIAIANVPDSGLYDEEICFDASSSYDPGGNIVSWAWDFGDGDTKSGKTVFHTYSSSGLYHWTLTVTDNDGQTDTCSGSILIEADHYPIVVINGPTEGVKDETLHYDSDGTRDDDEDGDEIVNYKWEKYTGVYWQHVTEGPTATSCDIVFTSAIGNKKVRLTVTDDEGNVVAESINVDISII